MTKPKPKLTMDVLGEAMKPPNNCRVKVFLDSMDTESRSVLEEALKLPIREFSNAQVRAMLVDRAGYDTEVVPGQDAFGEHRNGRKACRCRS